MATNYPNKSLTRAYEVAEAVESLGGKCDVETLAEKLGKKIGGSFHDDVNAAVKFDFLTKEKDQIRLSERFTNIQLSYTEDEKKTLLKESFLLPSLYGEVLNRFEGKEIPIDILSKILIREYNVSKSIAKTVGNNLIKGAEKVDLIQGGIVQSVNEINSDADIVRSAPLSKPRDETKKENQPVKATTANKARKSLEEGSNSTDHNRKINIQNAEGASGVTLNINIQLTVPETTNQEVYDKFFESMKKHLLS